MKGVMRFGRRGKLSPRYIGPFEILWTIGEVAYELALSPTFLAIHLVFHVSMLRRYVPNESHVRQYDSVELDDRLTFIDELIDILARDVRQLRSRAIPVVKVRWRHRLVEEATWRPSRRCGSSSPAYLSPQFLSNSCLRITDYKEIKVAMLVGDMGIARLMIHVQQVEEDKLRDREGFENKRAKTSGNESGQKIVMRTGLVSNISRNDLLHHLLVHLHQGKKLTTIVKVFRTSDLDQRIRKVLRHKGVLRPLHVLGVVGATQGCVVMTPLVASSVARTVIL
ncbi:hypothetical protein MTR67_007249 [Solanum verrucosum]|uniref:Tf2-1-like SH3-like domain-containing protein n=1 Tax=Solanum verrucosum TaxID=315347 RepID=A0AAF0Q5S5_SOLVR|nr:hypothetical protein MTR67_007249 [Solanum verrucosum]